MSIQCAVYDFRLSAEGVTEQSLCDCFKQLCKSYIFQEEKGEETGYLHYQGRLSLIKKQRKHEVKKLWEKSFEIAFPNFFEPTTDPPKKFDYDCYASKIQTRTRGPWSDQDKEQQYIPRQYRGKLETMRPFQQYIYDYCKPDSAFDDRYINLIYCPNGNVGKSIIAHLCRLHLGGLTLPPINDHKELIQACCNFCTSKKVRKTIPIFFDLPRAMNKERLNGIYTAIEVIKQGYLVDTRYKYQEWDMDCPKIWVFTNTEPEIDLLSKDRWNIWTIKNFELVKYDPDVELDHRDPNDPLS